MKKVYKTILIGAVIMGGGIMVIELLNIGPTWAHWIGFNGGIIYCLIINDDRHAS